jgi:hypothetical protein
MASRFYESGARDAIETAEKLFVRASAILKTK